MSKALMFTMIVSLALTVSSCSRLRFWIVDTMSSKAEPKTKTAYALDIGPALTNKGYKSHKVTLSLFLDGLTQPTDIQFSPKELGAMFVTEKTGTLKVVDLNSKKVFPVLTLPVSTSSEMGLLGIALDPQFETNRKFYLNYTVQDGEDYFTKIALWQLSSLDWNKTKAQELKVILKVQQPYPNHNAGQLAVGPDKKLYVGFGDGGWANDPHEHGQNTKTTLGTMQQIDLATLKAKTYTTGLRNPWRYSFDRKGRIIVADVGQNTWEEVSIIDKEGLNLGWNKMEANHCFKGNTCDRSRYHPAIIEYGRSLGQSITGGYEWLDNKKNPLYGHYVYADFASGRAWAAKLPENSKTQLAPSQIFDLGKWPLQISSFGRDPSGALYVAGFSQGAVYKLGNP